MLKPTGSKFVGEALQDIPKRPSPSPEEYESNDDMGPMVAFKVVAIGREVKEFKVGDVVYCSGYHFRQISLMGYSNNYLISEWCVDFILDQE